jgi:hypothetical protein
MIIAENSRLQVLPAGSADEQAHSPFGVKARGARHDKSAARSTGSETEAIFARFYV